MSSLVVFILIWGVWLITPVMIDGIDAFVRIMTVWLKRGDALTDPVNDEFLPTMAIIVPAHNEVAVIDRCLNSIKSQDYPSDRLEIIVVDDGSTDGTGDAVEEHV
ncbi:MAG: glycosyltransferase, partial [Actinomycetota bacterium]|nr:glycosyltransferase [Actinomycetota bacterium]